MKAKKHKHKLRKQKFIGAMILVITTFIIAIACAGTTMETKDATAVLLTLPLGLYLMFTKHIVIL